MKLNFCELLLCGLLAMTTSASAHRLPIDIHGDANILAKPAGTPETPKSNATRVPAGGSAPSMTQDLSVFHEFLRAAGVVLVLTKDGAMVGRGQTDADGRVTFANLAPGEYELVIDGPSLRAAIDKLAPPPAKKSSGPSVSIGGLFGGGSSRSSSGHEGAERGSSHSSGGMGLGLSVPLGGHGDDQQPAGYPITGINILLPGSPNANVSVETP